MFRKAIKETTASFAAELSALDAMRSMVQRTLAETRLSSKEIQQVAIALEEAATNIIRHSYIETSGSIELTITRYSRRVSIILRDTGRPYFPEEKTEVSLSRLVETERKGGLGQMMIQRLMDDVQYIAGDGFNELRMTKRLGGKVSAEAPLKSRSTSLRGKFSLATMAIMLLVVGGSYFVMETRVVSGIIKSERENMVSLGQSAAALAGAYILNRRTYVEFDELAYSYSSQHSDIQRVTIVDSTNLILADSKDVKLIRLKYTPPEGVQVGASITETAFTADGVELFYLQIPIISQLNTLGQISLQYGTESVRAKVAEARSETFMLIGIELLVGLILIYLLSNYFVKPIVSITEQVRLFGEGQQDPTKHTASLEGPNEGAEEFFVISRALNAMMTRLRRDSARKLEREKLDNEMEVASQIQKTLLPQELPNIPGLDLGSFYRPASKVGGDLYDIFPIGDNRHCIVVADVSGKGVPASLVMSVLRTVIRFIAPGEHSPAAVLKAVESHIINDIPSGVFITVALAIYDSSTREFKFASAGHNPVIHYRASAGEFSLVNPRGAPLGLGELTTTPGSQPHFEERRIEISRGDFLCLYTDGLSELEVQGAGRLGPEGIVEAFRRVGQRANEEQIAGAEGLVQALITELAVGRSEAQIDDDITVVIGRAV